MPSEKSYRVRSTDEELKAAFIQAARALRGTGRKLTRNSIANQAALHTPEGASALLKKLMEMDDAQFAKLTEPHATVGMEHKPLPAHATRPMRRR